MDASRFDAFARSISRPGSRRRLIGGFVAGVLGLAGFGRTAARTCTAPGTICREHANCCSGVCGPKDRTGRRRCQCRSFSDCPAPDQCHAATCDSGICGETVRLGVACDDGDVCTTGEICQADGSCGGGSPACDTTPPSVTINQADGQDDPTSTSPINFTVVFSEPVVGFSTSGVSLSGTAGATTAVVTEVAPNDGTTYNVAVSGMTTDGTVTASVPANAATDAGGNGNTPSTSTDNTVTFVEPVPSVTINKADGQDDPTSISPINFTVVFSELAFGFATGEVSLSGTAGATTAVVTEVAPNDGTTYNVAVSGMTGPGEVIASVPAGAATNTSGNGNTASTSTDNTVTFVVV